MQNVVKIDFLLFETNSNILYAVCLEEFFLLLLAIGPF